MSATAGKQARQISHEELSTVLPHVTKPSRYIGAEANGVVKEPGTYDLHLCLVFPDLYELGMSNTGLRILYSLANRMQGVYGERSFCPWPDMGTAMKNAGIPAYSMETHTHLADFDLVGITLQTEMAYTNIPYLLDLAQIPLFAAERGESDPLICGGGPNMANPEPVADFFDFLVIGDGEAIFPFVLTFLKQANKKGLSRQEKLEGLYRIAGVYVPSLYPCTENEHGEQIPEAGSFTRADDHRVKRMWVEELDDRAYQDPAVVPNMSPTQMRYGIEVMRGCTQGCRFCQAGYWYRPVRELAPDKVLKAMDTGVKSTGLSEFGLLSLSTADYSRVEDLVHMTKSAFLQDMHVNVALPSLRADAFTAGLAKEMGDVRGNSLTFAPETGSERLRRFINKNITNKQMYEAADIAYQNGWNNVKLYIMVGIPTETQEDIESIVSLSKEILAIGKKYGKRKTVSLNIGILSPKPFTALQWDKADDIEAIQGKLRFLWEEIKPEKDIKISFGNTDEYLIEAVLARGDRSLGRVIAEAYKQGTCFDAWSEHFRHDAWLKAFEICGKDPQSYLRQREIEETLPWDVIDMGVAKGYFRKDRRIAEELKTKPDCKWGDCNHCGIPGDYKDIKLAPNKLEDAPDAARLLEGESHADARVGEYATAVPWRISFRKRDWSRFISHIDTLMLLERALKRSGVRFKYTQGFNKRLKLSASPALPFGFESDCEFLDVHLLDEEVPPKWFEKLDAFLPRGLEIVSGHPRTGGDFSLSHYEAVYHYRVRISAELMDADALAEKVAAWHAAQTLLVGKPGAPEKKQFESKDWVTACDVAKDGLQVSVRYVHNHASLRLVDFLRVLMDTDEQTVASVLVRRTGLDVASPVKVNS